MRFIQYLMLLLLLGNGCLAQSDVELLIRAEKGFAAYTAIHSVKEGFLRYLDSSGVVFNQGKVIPAIALYQKAPVSPVVLFWQPAFSVISASGELGMNTGPFTVRPSAQDSVTGRGSFSSIWKKNEQGEFKLLVDLGSTYDAVIDFPVKVQKVVLTRTFPQRQWVAVRSLDSLFNAMLEADDRRALAPYLHTSVWVNARGHRPATGIQEVKEILTGARDVSAFKTLTGELSRAGDFAYFYGAYRHGTRPGNYLRVWVREGSAWRIILQTTD